MQLLGLSIASAAWFPFAPAPAPEPDSNMRVDAKGAVEQESLLETGAASSGPKPAPGQVVEEDLSQDYTELAQEITQADQADAVQNDKLSAVAKEALSDVDLLKVDCDNAVNKTLSESQTVAAATNAVAVALSKAEHSVQQVVDLDSASAIEYQNDATLMQEKASNAVLSINGKAAGYLQKLAGGFDVNYLQAEQSINKDMQAIESTTNKVETTSHAELEKTQTKVDTVADKLGNMKDSLNDQVSDIDPKIKDFQRLTRGDSKSLLKLYSKSMKNIADEVETDEPVDPKESLKAIQDSAEKVDDAAEEGTENAEEKVEDIKKDVEDQLKTFTKNAESTAKKMVKDVEKQSVARQKEIQHQMKNVEDGIGDTQNLQEKIKTEIVDSVADRTRSVGAKLSEKSGSAAMDMSQMFKKVSESAEKSIAGVQVSADAAAAEMSSDNGADAADAADKAYKVSQNIDDEAQGVAMHIDSQIGGLTSEIASAKTAMAGSTDSAADVSADIEAANLAAKSQQNKAEQEGTRALNQMTAVQQALGLDMKIKVGSAETDLKTEKDAFSAKSSSVKQTLEMPITMKIDALMRDLESKVAQATIGNNEVFGKLQAELKEVKGRMQAAGIDTSGLDLPENKVLTTVQKAQQAVTNLQRAKDMLQKDVEHTPAIIGQKTEMAVRNLKSFAREAQQDMIKSKLEDVRKTETTAFDALGVINRKLDQNQGAVVANEQRDTEQASYLEKRIGTMVDDLDGFKTQHEEMDSAQKSKMAEFSDELLPSYVQTAGAAAASAQAAAEASLSEGEQSLQAVLRELATQMANDASTRGAATQGEIKAIQEKLMKDFKSSTAVEDSELAHIFAKAEGLTFDTQNATHLLEEEQESVSDKAVEADQAANLDVARVKSQVEQSKTDEASLDGIVTKGAEESIAYAKRSASGDIKQQAARLLEEVTALKANGQGITDAAKAELQKEMGKNQMLEKEVSETVKNTEQKQASVSGDIAQYNAQVVEQVDEDRTTLTDDSATLDNKLKVGGGKFQTTEDRDKQLVQVMSEDSESVREEADASFATMSAQTDAKTKAMAGQIDASFQAAEMQANSAKQSLEASKIDLTKARDALIGQMNGVQDALNRKANETGRAVVSFDAGLQNEREMLAKNVDYLRAFDLTTQGQVLALLTKVEDTIGGVSETASVGFKEVEAKEKQISASMGSLLEGQAFGTLQKIMDADNYVQKASTEDAELVSYMNEFKGDQERFMAALIQALYDNQYALILHEEEVKAEQAAIDADSNGLTSSVISSLSSLVSGDASNAEAAQLEGMTAGTLQMLLSKATTGSAQDKAQIALLLAKIHQNGLGGLSHLANAKELVDAINAAVSGNGAYDAMKFDLQRVVDFNQKLVDDERKRMEKRGVALSDKLFFGGGDINRIRTPSGFEHVPEWQKNEYKNEAQIRVQQAYKADSFLERQRKYIDASTDAARKALLSATPQTAEQKERHSRVSALLEKNQQLMAESKALAEEHAALGASVEDVTSQLRSGKHKKDTL